jgi:hypothetical protein
MVVSSVCIGFGLLVHNAPAAPALRLKFTNMLDRAFERDKRVAPSELHLRLKSEFDRLMAVKKPKEADLISLGAGLMALKLVHFKKFQWKDSLRQRNWLHQQFKRIGPCLESAIVDYYATDLYDIVLPKDIIKSDLPGSPIASMFAFKTWDMQCKTAGDLKEMQVLWVRVKSIGLHKRYLLGMEGSLEFNTFQATRDFSALRKATDLFKAGAKLEPNPKTLKTTIEWCKPWDDWLAKEGK